MPGSTDELAQILSKVEKGKTQELSRKLAWKFTNPDEPHMLKDAISSKRPIYPSRCNGKNRFDGSVIAVEFDPSMVGYWSFDDPITGTIAYDAIQANRNNGTITGATFVSSKYNTGLSFAGSGSGNRVEFPNLGISSGSFTIEVWVNPARDESDGYGSIVGYDETHRILLAINGTLLTQFGGNYFSNGLVTANVWSHIVYVYDFSTNLETFYINGVPETSHTPSVTPIWNAIFWAGAYIVPSVSYHYHGKLDELRIYNSALSPVRIGQHARDLRFP